tara:strand:+ start:1744 stop:2322 length:579 start_codon:yes stop_codon:yes gene_type:complete
MDGLMSSRRDSLARTYLSLEQGEALRRIEADYSLRLQDYRMRSTPIAELDRFSYWKTSQVCYLETGELGLDGYTGSWPDEGIIVSGRLYPQPMWERLISGGGGGASAMWPTPAASDIEGGIVQNVELENGSFSRKNRDGIRWGVKLRDAVNHVEPGQLNSDWVEWLMGYPPGWTNLETSPEWHLGKRTELPD